MANPLVLWDRDPVAMECLAREALKLQHPGDAGTDLKISLALSLMFQRRLQEASEVVRTILAADPEQPLALWADAQLSFYNDDPWPGPWRRLEARWGAAYSGARPFPPDRTWDGSPLAGRTLLFAGEGGLGDQIQFIRFAPLLRAAGAGRLIASADQALIPLLSTVPGVDVWVPRGPGTNEPREEIAFDAGLPMLSAPGVLGITRETLPAVTPYVSSSQIYIDRARHLIEQYGGTGSLNVGLCWQSLKKFRAVPAEVFEPLTRLPGVRLYGLGERPLIDAECAALGIPNLGAADILSTAGAVMALDLIISPDTMMVHLAGALGRPVWLLLHYLADWRWPFEGETTPWYPTAKLFRRERDNWRSVSLRLCEELNARLRSL